MKKWLTIRLEEDGTLTANLCAAHEYRSPLNKADGAVTHSEPVEVSEELHAALLDLLAADAAGLEERSREAALLHASGEVKEVHRRRELAARTAQKEERHEQPGQE